MEKVDFTKRMLAIRPDLHRFAYKLTADHAANDLVIALSFKIKI